MELSQKQAANIEESQTVNKLSSQSGHRNQRNWNAKAGTSKDGGRATDKKSRNRKSRGDGHEIRKSSDKCRNCGGDYPHPGRKTSCPAYQATCRGCSKLNHFEAVCRSKGKGSIRNKLRPTVNKVSEDETSDEGEVYTFSLSAKTPKNKPLFKIKVYDMPVTITADSGASINILDEKEYRRLPNCPQLEPSIVKIYGYQSKVPLGVLRKFSTTFSSGSLVSWKTSQDLSLLQTFSKSNSYRRNWKQEHPRVY